jgi:hypothetical protein
MAVAPAAVPRRTPQRCPRCGGRWERERDARAPALACWMCGERAWLAIPRVEPTAPELAACRAESAVEAPHPGAENLRPAVPGEDRFQAGITNRVLATVRASAVPMSVGDVEDALGYRRARWRVGAAIEALLAAGTVRPVNLGDVIGYVAVEREEGA